MMMMLMLISIIFYIYTQLVLHHRSLSEVGSANDRADRHEAKTMTRRGHYRIRFSIVISRSGEETKPIERLVKPETR